MNLFDVYPLYDIEIDRGIGSQVWDRHGTAYTDLYGGHAVISIGHSHPYYVQKINAQLQKIGFYSNSVQIPGQQELAAKLIELSGKKDYSLFLCNSGAEANENAFKIASFYNRRKKIIAFYNSFHGRTSLACAATDNPAIQTAINPADTILFLPLNDSPALDQAFAGEPIGAVIVEGIQGVGGIHPADPAFLRQIRRLCDQYGSVYIADSVQCGYGRSGQFFAHDLAGDHANADIYTMAKGMGNGFPLAGVLIAPKFEARHGMLGTTFGGNHLAAAAGIAVLDILKSDHLIGHALTMGEYLIEGLEKIPGLKQIRGRGLMLGIEFYHSGAAIRSRLLHQYKIFTGGANDKNVIRLLPALNLNRALADSFLGALMEIMINYPDESPGPI